METVTLTIDGTPVTVEKGKTVLQAVLESQAWDDAARLVTSFDPEAAPGVAPYVNDKSLLASLPVPDPVAQAERREELRRLREAS